MKHVTFILATFIHEDQPIYSVGFIVKYSQPDAIDGAIDQVVNAYTPYIVGLIAERGGESTFDIGVNEYPYSQN